jgi:hypothetical protein
VDTKICGRCGIEKPIKKFRKDKRRPDCRTITCRECYTNNKLEIWIRTPEQIQAQREKLKGRKYSIEHRLAISKGNKRRINEGNHNFLKHGKGYKDEDRHRIEYAIWKEKLLERADYKCEKCGGLKRLCGHHKKCFYEYPELRFDLDNGEILCHVCHQRLHHLGIPKNRKGS